MNETLEAMAQALFKSWFIDFDPVIDNAILAGNPIPEELKAKAEKRRNILQENKENSQFTIHHSLFPNSFTQTEELGWVPEGWEVTAISDLAELNPESWSKKNAPEKVTYLDLSNVKNGNITESIEYNFSDAPSRARRILRQHDTIIGTVRPGNRSYSYIQDAGYTGSTGFAVLRPRNNINRAFTYLALTQDENIDNFAHLADGAAYPAIKPEVVANTIIAQPSENILISFEVVVAPLLLKLGNHQCLSKELCKLRNVLLTKLIPN